MRLILPLKFRKESSNQATSQIVWKRLQHQGSCFDWERSGWLSRWQSKQREIFCGNDSGWCRMEFSWSLWDATWISQPPTLGHPKHLHERSGHRSTVNMMTLFTDIFFEAKQNHVSRDAAGTLIPEWRSRPDCLSSKTPWHLLFSSCWDCLNLPHC